MIIVTGGAGFIGSVVVSKLNKEGINDILVVDSLKNTEKWKNLIGKKYSNYMDKSQLIHFLKEFQNIQIDAIIHMGACSSTTEKNADYLIENNYQYTKYLAEYCVKRHIRFIYASSAATYGNGSQGFSDNQDIIPSLRPLNMYGYSKQMLDEWILMKNYQDKVVGLKFFNVFGPNEYHKGEMSSVIYKSFFQILHDNKISLFKSYHPEFGHGEQKRDFIYVKDCAEVIWQLLNDKSINGIFNLGTGLARSWKDLANAVFKAMNITPNIEFIEMPEYLREKYQYFTQAEMTNLLNTPIKINFTSLEDAVKDYVTNYLAKDIAYE